jgi:phosphoketolase
MGRFLRDVMKLNMDARNFRLFSPDENNSNRWQDALEVTNRAWVAETLPWDDHLAPDGRVMEMLSEHQCQGWLEGYLLTGRHGFFSCYEAFIHIIDSMFNQHAKWLKVCHDIPWRRPIASLNYLLSSHVWRQDHNGFSHQDPGFIDHVVNKKAKSCASTCRPTRTASCPSPTTACAAGTTSTWSWPASSRPRSGSPWTRRSAIARPDSASGSGRATTAAASPTS